MAMSTAQIVSKWKAGLSNASQAYVAGTGAVTSSPMAAAAAQAPKAAQNYANAVNSGRWAASLTAVPLSYWKNQCSIASQKLGVGAQKGEQKYAAGMQRTQAARDGMRAASQQAGGGEAGMVAAMRLMKSAGKKAQSGVI